MSTRGIAAPVSYQPHVYWESRARRFAAVGDGLAAVCSYGMPRFHNLAIHWSQRLALAPWLRIPPGTRVLDIGCGIGRWSRMLAARGAAVTGIDLSPTMIAQARWRDARERLEGRCRFEVQDLSQLDLGQKFDLVLGVTVLQHILDKDALRAAVARISDHLAEKGRIVLLEAAPSALATRCDTTVFKARERATYLQLFAECGLKVQAVTGVDPAPFRTWVLPHLPRWPRPLADGALALATALSLPVDLPFGRLAARRSWHAVFVLAHDHGSPHAH